MTSLIDTLRTVFDPPLGPDRDRTRNVRDGPTFDQDGADSTPVELLHVVLGGCRVIDVGQHSLPGSALPNAALAGLMHSQRNPGMSTTQALWSMRGAEDATQTIRSARIPCLDAGALTPRRSTAMRAHRGK